MTNNPDTTPKTENPPVKTSTNKRRKGYAIKTLSKASARSVNENAEKIVERLLSGALEGDLKSAELLIELIEKVPPTKSRRKLTTRELIQRLARQREPTLPAEPPEDEFAEPRSTVSSSETPSPAGAPS